MRLPADLVYSANPAIYIKGVAITDNVPSSTGSAVDSYSITPSLPGGLSLDTSSGVISGTPTALSGVGNYTVTATNLADSATVTVRIAVNDVALDLVAHWPLDEANGRSVANAVGLHNGTVMGSAEWKPGEGRFGGAIYFSGSDGFIEVPDASDFRFAENQSWAVSLWYKTGATQSSSQGLITKGFHDTTRSDEGYWLLRTEGSTFGFGSRPGSGDTPWVQISSDSGVSPADDQWHHFVVTRDGSLEEIRVYVDGHLTQHDASGTDQGMWAVGDNDDPLIIGNHEDRYTPGWFDDIAIWKGYALTDTDVKAISEGVLANITKAPGALTYSANPAIYTKGEAITDNEPSSTGSAVDSYSITPSLPAGLSLDTATGVISGMPTELSTATSYVVTATNSGGSATVTLRMTVNDVKHVVILLEGTDGSRDMRVTFNGTGSWTTTGTTLAAFAIAGDWNVANSSDASLDGEKKEVFWERQITGGNSMEAALSGSFDLGQYVAFATPITMTADAGPSSFSVIGLLFDDDNDDDDNDPTAGQDDIALVTNQPDSNTWPSATEISYTVGASTTFSLDSGIGATFDQAFNQGLYNLDEGLAGSLEVGETVPPADLVYSANPAVYTKDMAITDNEPSSTGSAVDSYSITPSLPAGLSLDTSSGVISGTPTESSAATDYTVTATNAGGSGTVTLRMAVNEVKHVVILLEGTDGSRDMRITFNGTGSWMTESESGTSFSVDGAEVANSSDASLGDSSKEALRDDQINGGNPMNAALSGSFGNGQYIALATPIAMTAAGGGGPSSFKVIGLLFDTDNDPQGGEDDIDLVTDQPETSTWSSGSEISYTVGASTTFSLDSGIGATFGQAFNKGIYTLNASVVGSLEVAETVPPSELFYLANSEVYTVGEAITDKEPSSTGSAVDSYSITPSLPAGLSLDTSSGVISGRPTEPSAATDYTVTATNTGGSATVTLRITVKDVAPSALSYATNLAVYTKGVAITKNTPSSEGGAVVSYSIAPALPAGLGMDTGSGVVSGTPSEPSAATDYTVTATNSGGSTTARFRMAVNDVKHVVILLEGASGSRDMKVTFNGTGSWVTEAETASAFTHGDPNVANSSDASLGGSSKEGFHDSLITGGNAMKAALSGSFDLGQYVAFANPIAMTANPGPSSFNAIGFLFDDDSDPIAGQDNLILVTDQADTSSWPSATEISYTVGVSTTFSLDSGVGTTFDQAFNQDLYTLDEGLVGSLEVAVVAPPADLIYSANPAIYIKGVAITDNVPSSTGSAVDSYSITPSLPGGLSLDTSSGVISGTPTALSGVGNYTVTATNLADSATVTVRIAVNDVALDLVAHWPLDEANGRSVANAVGLHNGTVMGSAEWKPGEGRFGGAIYFSGSDGFIEVPDASDFRFAENQSWAVSLWYKTGATQSSSQGLITKGFHDTTRSDEGYWLLRTEGSTFGFGSRPGSGDTPWVQISSDSGVSPADDQWHHFVVTRDGSLEEIRVYVDGHLTQHDASGTDQGMWAMGDNDDPLIIGNHEDRYTPGWFDDIAIWKGYALTDTDVKAISEGVLANITKAPGALTYSANPAIYTKGEAITDNEPSSTGSAVDSYSITPSLPAGLSLDTATGVISGMPTELSTATSYVVTATNSGGSATVTLRMTVNDVKHVVILLEGTDGSRDMRVTFNGTGSWTTTGTTLAAFAIAGDWNVANSSDASLDGEKKEVFWERQITGGNSMEAALSGSFDLGQYVAFATPITMTADAGPSSFSVIGLLFDDDNDDDDNDPTAGQDDIALVTNQPDSNTWPSATEISYTVGASTTFSLDSGIGATFDQAFNQGLYNLDEGLAGSLEVGETVPPADLVYSANPAVYTKDMAITDNEPSSTGSAVDSYSITPSLPAGLSLDTSSGVISGTPTESSAATDYTVTATNAGGSGTVTLRMAVNEVKHVVILLEGTDGSRDMRITFNGTGSWITESESGTSFSVDGAEVANSSDASLGDSSKEALRDDQINGGNPMNAALSGSFGNGQYIALATPIAMTAAGGGGPSSFKVIGLLFDTDNDPQGGEDDIDLVTDQPETSTWSSGSEISYTVGASTTFSLDSGIGATFGQAFNKGIYTLNASVVGSLEVAETVPPSELFYLANSEVYTVGEAITDKEPSSTGSAVDSYSITPSLPAGLSLDTSSGVISGRPTEPSAATDYTVTATNTGGSATVTLRITVKDVAPSALSYATNLAVYTKGVAITKNTPSSEGGAVVSYSIAPALPAGLGMDTGSGVVSGTPSEPSAVTDYTVTATNSGGSAAVTVSITVNDVAPSALSYAITPVIYTKDVGITNNTPSSEGGAVVSYSITPSLPTGLSFDTSSGVISGTPSSLSAATDYTVTATNTGGSATVTVSITVNDVAPSALSYAITPVIYTKDVGITDNTPSSAGGAVVSYSITPSLPTGLSFDTSSGVISGTPSSLSAATDYTVTATNTGGSATVTLRITVNDVAPSALSYATNLAVYTKGVAITKNTPSSTGGAVVSYSIAPALPAGLGMDTGSGVVSGTPSELTAATDYTVTATNTGGSATVVLRITVNDVAPSALRYATNPAVYTVGVAITNNTPSSGGGAVESYSIDPALPAGLSLDTDSGVVSGTPGALSEVTDYTVTATNSGGSATVTVSITVNDAAPRVLSYVTTLAFYTVGVAITDNTPSSEGGAVVTYSISPALPAELSLDTATGVISGTPSGPSALAHYTVTATNSGGSATVTLRLTVNDVPPIELSYATHTAFYTVGVAITNNTPSSKGGAVVTYSISPALPAGLSLDTATGVISGTPSAVSAATSYVVSATNSGGSATVTLRIAVNGVKHLFILLEGTSGSRDMRVTFNGTGSWITSGSTSSAFTYGDSNIANSSDASLGGSSSAGIEDNTIAGGNSMNPALNGSFAFGQYVAFGTPIAMTADAGPSSFNVIGLLFDDDSDPRLDEDDITLVTDQPADTSSWSFATEISYTVGASTTFSLDSGIGATFEQAFNKDIYTLDDGVVGNLKIGETAPPAGLVYSANPAAYAVDIAIADNVPSSTGSAVEAYSIDPALPAGLSLDMATGVISGTPTEVSAVVDYTVTATNAGGSATVPLRITVNGEAPGALSYATNSAVYTKDVTIVDNVPFSTGGAVVAYSIMPPLPTGLSIDPVSGVISGTPSELSEARDYTVTATNSVGSATAVVRITVNDVAPSALSYATNPAVYTVGVAIADNEPSSTGGAVESYSITPLLPAGLSLGPVSGVISGTPSELSEARDYTVTATNSVGSATAVVRITVNDVAPSALRYATNPAVYTVGVAITDNEPSSKGGAVVSYAIAPSLPTGLSFDAVSGVISGMPAELSEAREYAVTATNSGGSAMAVVRITVNDVAPAELRYATNPAVYTVGVAITDNEPSSTGGAVVRYAIAPSLPTGLSFDPVSGVISGTPSELSEARDYTVTATNSGGSATAVVRITVNDVAPSALSYATNPAVYTMGVAITDNVPSSTGGAVVSYSIAPSLPTGLGIDPVSGVISGTPSELSEAREHTVTATNSGGSATVTLGITVKDVAPSALAYSVSPAIYTVGVAIADNMPFSTGGAVVAYSITPLLPAGLSFDPGSGVISGTPSELSEARDYTVTATNSGGSATAVVRITVNDIAPSALRYATNPAVYTVGVAITDNEPSSTGGAVVSYAIAPSLPTGLSFDPVSGVISGTPAELSEAREYAVTATNSGGSATVTLGITVKDVAPSALAYSVSPGIYTVGVAIADNMPFSTGGAVEAYSITPVLPAGLSFDPGSGLISGTPSELSAVTDYTVTAINTGGSATVTVPITVIDAALPDVAPAELSYATNPAIYTMGVAIADNVPSSTGGAVVAYAIAPSLPAGLGFDPVSGVISGVPLELSEARQYTVTAANSGGAAAVAVMITVNAMAPGELAYSTNPVIHTLGVAITDNVPSSTGGAVVAYSITPSLPVGLSLDTGSGVISGVPLELSEARDYAVTATNSGGSDTMTLRITVKDVAPSALTYSASPGIYTVGVAIAENMPSSTGGAVVAYSITPVLPLGLSFDPVSGLISGTPSELSAVTDYTVTAINTGGSTTVTVPITVIDAALPDVAPAELSYATNPAIYTLGVAIADNVPSSTGGAVVAYAIAPSLPAGLSFDPVSGVISGVPLELSEARQYTVTAANSGGAAAVAVMITVNAMAPGELAYSTNPVIYTLGVAITDNVPSSTGGAVVAYSITPSLPVGLSLDTGSGVISGVPLELSEARQYTVTAANSGGSTAVTVMITATAMAPGELTYSTNPGIYTVGVAIIDNVPSSTGGVVAAYSIAPGLPVGLSLDTGSGVISGVPAEPSEAREYAVAATNSGGSATVTLRITVNDVAPSVLAYSVSPGIYPVGVAIADNMPSSAGGAVVAYSITPVLPAGLSFDPGSGVISGTPSELSAVTDYTVTAINSGGSTTVTVPITVTDAALPDVAPTELSYATNPAIYTMGVAIADNVPSSTGGAVVAYSIAPSLPVGLSFDPVSGVISGVPLELSEPRQYMVTAANSGGSTAVAVMITVNAMAPGELAYSTNPAIYTVGVAIADNAPSSTGGTVVAYSIAPSLPAGLSLDTKTGVISGMPAELSEAKECTVTATNSGGSATVTLRITVNDVAPSALAYSVSPGIYTVDVAIAENMPSSTGGAVVAYSITPVLPAGLSFDPGSGVISGTPSELSAVTDYTVTAINSGGSTTVTVPITVTDAALPDVAPTELSYATNPAIYTMGVAIADNVPSSTGGAVVAYSIAPSLPVGLSFDPVSGVISGVPLELSEPRQYMVTAANSGGSTAVTVMITVNAMAPGELAYSTNPAIYTLGVAITDNVPSSTGGAVEAYVMASSLPAGLSLDTKTGVISGMPAELSEAKEYTVTATNSGGSATAVVTITVKDMAPSALAYSVSPGIYTVDVAIADNMPSSIGGAVVAYSITPVLPAGLGFDPVSGLISGTPNELSAVTDYTVTAINSGGSTTVRVPITITDAALPDVAPAELSYATNPGIYTMGVAIADNVPSSTGGAVVAYSIAPSLPAGLSFDPVSGVISGMPLELSEARDYTVTAANAGGSTAVTVMITVNAMAPGELAYSTNPAIYTVGVAIDDNIPSSTGGTVVAYVMAPSLPAGLSLDTKTGVISGLPAELSEARECTVTATNSGGSATVTLRITVNDVAPSALAYSVSPAIYTVDVAVADNMPSSTGGAVVAYSITPVLPAGLSFDPVSGVISGTPNELSAVTDYTVTAINSGGSTTVRVPITITDAALPDVAPAELSYATNPGIYTMDVAIADNVPSSTGGAVVAYSIAPSLPAGLSFDPVSGVISGMPAEPSEARDYTVTAANAGGSTAVTVMITVNAMAPGELAYSTNPAIYTVGVAIADNAPSSTGGTVVAYSIAPSLPAGLSLDTKTGVISGLPAELSEARECTVTATNSGGSATVTLRITVNDVAPSALAYSVSPAIYTVDVAVADNMPSSTGGAVAAYSITPVLPAGLSFDPVSGVISGTPNELSAVTDYTVTAINTGGSTTVRVPITVTDAALPDVAPAELSYATNPGIYTMGVAIADNVPSSTGGAVVAYSIAPSLPAGLSFDPVSGVISGVPLELSEPRQYMVTAANSGGSTAVTVMITVNAMAPGELAYSTNPAIYTLGVAITDNVPSSTGGAVEAYVMASSLPAGLSLDTKTGVISGMPAELSEAKEYTVTATNSGGSATAVVTITVKDMAPSALAYSVSPGIYTVDVAIADNMPSSIGGAVVAYSITPVLPAGLGFDPVSGLISGTPSELSAVTDYTVTAINTGGSTTVTVPITVTDAALPDVAPTELSYATNPAIYTMGVAIADNVPSSTGGVVVAYSIAPSLPAGLSFDPVSGVISGMPLELNEARDYTVTAANAGGSTAVTVMITVNAMAPGELTYSTNPGIYTVGVAIDDNIPSSTGGTVVAYVMAPSLPAGLSLDTKTGVISGLPAELSEARECTVTATNSGGSATVTLRITVNDVAPSALAYSVSPGIYTVDVAVADNMPSSTGGAVVAYSITPVLPAGLGFDPVSGVISGTPNELSAVTDYTVTAINSGGAATVRVPITVTDAALPDVAPAELSYATNPGIYTMDVAIADNVPSSTGGAVVAYSIAPSLPAGLSFDPVSGVISGMPAEPSEARDYTVTAANAGGSTAVTVMITVNAMAPGELAYSTNPAIYTVGVAIADNAPSSTGGTVVAYSIAPSLPAGLSLDTKTGVISGLPAELSEARECTVTATNSGGSATVTLRITVNDVAPSALAYSVSPAIYTVDVAVADNMPSSTGGAVAAYSITPVLPAGLSFDPVSGVISGTPNELSAVTDYTVTAINTGGSTTVRVPITVTDAALPDVAPAELSYATNPGIYTMGVAIADNVPSSTGGAVVAYSIAPSLPAGLSFDPVSGVISGVPAEPSEARDYTVTAANAGGSATVTLRITVSTVTDMAPAELSYTTNPASYTVGFAISRNSPFSKGGVVDSYSIMPALPVGLSLDTRTGVISGGPAKPSAARDYMVTATNSLGSTTATLRIMVEDAEPSALSYATNPAIYTVGVAIAENVPSSTGGAVVAYSGTPVLPAGLSLDTGSGVISGTPTEPSAVTDYMVTATNSRGSTTVTLRIVVEDAAPGALSYAMNPAIYTVGEAITDNRPSSTGGVVVAYSITPVLPAGLSLDTGSGVISGTPAEPGEAGEYTVTATNSGGSTTAVVTITVKGRHPQYTNSGPFNVAENSVNGTLAGDADAIDADGGAKDVGVTYAIQSGNDSVDGDATPAFGLDPDTGVLTVRDQDDLDHETQSFFALVIRATDGDGFTDVIVTIQIDNVPEAPVSTGLTPVYVMIGATDGVIDLATVFSDEEDADLSCSISFNSNTALFTSVGIDEETGRLILDFAPNIAGKATLEVTATDSDGQSVSASLVVTVSGNALEEWRHANFSAADLGDPAKEATLWGNSANPDEDLWSNAFEFFFGTDPNSFDEGYPLTYEVRQVGVDGSAVLEFERSKAVPAGVGVVEASGDLSQWQVVRGPAVVMEDLGDRERVQVRIPMEEQAKQSFVRLVVDLGMN